MTNLANAKPYIWQTDTAVANNSWCYTEGNQYKKTEQIVCDLVDIVSKNGRLLLNIGPKADGTIPEEDKNILLTIGDWLKVNGEAVYGAKMWRTSAEGPTEIVEVLGYDENPEWVHDKEGLKIKTVKMDTTLPVVFKMTVN